MRSTAPALLIGSNLAVLVAANEIVNNGTAVALLTDGKPLGGHFAGMRTQEAIFDMGMVLLELPTSGVPAQRRSRYQSSVRSDWTRFGGEVTAWLRQMPIRRVPTLTVQLDGRSGPDYLISNRLDLLYGDTVSPPALLADEDPLHARHKNLGSAYDTLTYLDAARVNHGQAWHDKYIRPFSDKVFGVPAPDFLARYHRAAWLPLYYPETLASALNKGVCSMPEYEFFTTDTGFVGALVERLVRRLMNSPLARVISAPIRSLDRHNSVWRCTVDEVVFSAATVGLGIAPGRCRELLSLPFSAPQPVLAASVAIMFCLLNRSEIGRGLACHMVVDPDFATYRVTDQDALAGLDPPLHRIVIEASPDRLSELQSYPTEAAMQVVLLDELRRLMCLRNDQPVQIIKFLIAKNALPVPTQSAVRGAEILREELEATTTGLLLTGSLLDFGATSLNDQIVQGLQLAADLS